MYPQGPARRVKFVRDIIKEVAGQAPYEKRVMELLKVGKEKRALKLCKRKVGCVYYVGSLSREGDRVAAVAGRGCEDLAPGPAHQGGVTPALRRI